MFIWIIALVLFASLGIVGFYQGAVRVGVSLIGLVIAAALALPLAGIVAGILKIFGLEHPVPLGFIAPFVAFVLVLIGFKCGGLALHKKLDTYYKYKASDTVRLLFERLNARAGICLGLANAFIYMILISVAIYVVGYFTVQTATSDKDNFVLRVVARLAEDLRATRVDKAVAKFIPSLKNYYDGCDVVALIFRNPLLQNRLSTYPVFLTYADKQEFKQIAEDTKIQEEWVKSPSLSEFLTHDKMQSLVQNREMFTNTVAALGGDFEDLKSYLETGKSPKYDDEKILGRWDFKENQSFLLAKKKKPNMTLAESKQLRLFLSALRNATLTATLDNKVILKLPSASGSGRGPTQGSWASSAGAYSLTIPLGERNLNAQAHVDGDKLISSGGNYSLVFEK